MEDYYAQAKKKDRPHPTSQDGEEESKALYVEKDEVPIHSAIRLDDIQTFLRVRLYQQSLERFSRKLSIDLKWLHRGARFPIFRASRRKIAQLR